MTLSQKVVELREYATKNLSKSELGDVEANLLHSRYGAQIQLVPPSFLNEYQWQLTSLGWVGHIPLTSDVGLRLAPKVALGNLFGMLEYAYRLKSFRFLSDLVECRSLEEFYERLANILAKRILDRARKGFYRSYLAEHDHLPYVRGRMDMRQTTRASWDVRLACRYEEHTPDIEDNQLLTYTMWRIARSGSCSEQVLPTIRNAYRSLQSFTTLQPFTANHCQNRNYNRLNQDYQPLHALSRFFLEQTGPTHELGDRQIMPFLIDMAQLFELFVAEWLNVHLPEDWQVRMQERVYFVQESSQHFKIDLVLVNSYTGLPHMVLDTKYKAATQPSNNDISQVVAYAESIGCDKAVLIYPQTLKQPFDAYIGNIHVRSIAFALDGDLEAGGHDLLSELELW